MRWPPAKRNLIVTIVLISCGLAICAWQVQEHQRFKEAETAALIKRGLDITSTLGVVIHSQGRLFVSKERLSKALQDLVTPGEPKSAAILGSTGEVFARAGEPLNLTPEMLKANGIYWNNETRTLTIMNLVDLLGGAQDGTPAPPPIIVSEGGMPRDFRRPRDTQPKGEPQPAEKSPKSEPAPVDKAGQGEAAAVENSEPPAVVTTAQPVAPTQSNDRPPAPRPPFGRPPWIPKETYEELLRTKGISSLVISLSTAEMQNLIKGDLLLRSMVSLLAMGGAIISSLAWRNVSKNSELQIRLVKAGEANIHLKEMNFAAAGLAHETRNPLNLIRGLAQMIAMQPEAPVKLKDHAATIIEEADRVTVQLNEFINYSKPREAHLAPVDTQRLAADVARTLVLDIEEKQIELVLPAKPMSIEADEQLFRQALFNVLLNAVQAVGPGGKIEIRLTAVDARQAMLEIRDDGPGVPAAERANIFKPYVTMRPKGVGLGLAIVQQIVAAHRWEVSCEANEPHGAIFRFKHLRLASPAL